mgnify:FL=1
MKRYALLLTLTLFMGLFSSAKVHIYSGANTYYSDIMYTWDGKHVYSGANTYYSDMMY